MTESEWDACTDAREMLQFVADLNPEPERKVRLFLASFCRYWGLGDERARDAVEFVERVADDLPSRQGSEWPSSETEAEVEMALRSAFAEALRGPTAAQEGAGGDDTSSVPWDSAREEARAYLCDLLRDTFGPLPFRPVAVDPAWLSWNGGAVQHLAEAAYRERTPQGAIDPSRLAVLSDALEEAGCRDAEVLSQLRQPRDRYRGFWVLDLLLGKE